MDTDQATSSTRGGKRPGAGRKTKAQRNAGKTLAIEEQIAAYAPTALANLTALADGSITVVKRKRAAASTLKMRDVLRDEDGKPIPDPKTGKYIVIDVLMFPDAGPDEMILVAEEELTGQLDFKANEYLLNRHLGRPKEAPGEDGAGLNVDEALEQAEELAGSYVDPDGGPADGPVR